MVCIMRIRIDNLLPAISPKKRIADVNRVSTNMLNRYNVDNVKANVKVSNNKKDKLSESLCLPIASAIRNNVKRSVYDSDG